MGAFIWEDNIAGKFFPMEQETDMLNWRSFMMNYEENPIAKGVLFLSSMKSQENVEQMVMQIKVQCAKRNILVEDVAVEHNLIGDMDMDRPVVKSVVNATVNTGYEVLVVRNQYDVTEDDSDWEKFVGDMADMDVRVYLADTGEFVSNAYGNDRKYRIIPCPSEHVVEDGAGGGGVY